MLQPDDMTVFTEGLNVFSTPVPQSLSGKSLIASRIRERTGCSVIAVNIGERQHINPDPHFILEGDGELILIGSEEAENRFFDTF
jgi:K+/H+ antiporter YhaU regulatory subunit KhtT